MTVLSRIVEALVAAALGAVLLVAAIDSFEHGGGTPGFSVQHGELDFALGDGTWNLDSPESGLVPVSSGTRFAPGDVFVLSQPVIVTMTDDSLRAHIALEAGDLVPAAVAPYVTVTFAAPTLGAEIADSTYRVTAADAGEISTTVTVAISTDLPQDISEGTRLHLDALTFTMQQTTA